jgi:hypothetical protein
LSYAALPPALMCSARILATSPGRCPVSNSRFALNWRLQLLTLLAELNKEM